MTQRALEDLGQGCLDPKEARKAIRDTVRALVIQARELATMDPTAAMKCPECRAIVKLPLGPKEMAQAISNGTKAVDDLTRLVEFVEGRADSRPDNSQGLSSFMKLLTQEQFETLGKWLSEAESHSVH